MPSWAPAITSEMFSIARSVVRAAREPSWARGSIWLRRAASRANSAPTKNALRASRTTARHDAEEVAVHRPASSAGGRSGLDGDETQVDAVDPQAVHPLDGQGHQPLARLVGVGAVGHRDLDAVARLGDLAELAHDQAGDGVVVLVVGQLDVGGVLDLVGAQQAGERPAAVAALADARAEAVVLVGDVADDLLDHVLEGHDPGVAAVLVEHDGHLEAVLAQQREQRVEPQAVGHDDRA